MDFHWKKEPFKQIRNNFPSPSTPFHLCHGAEKFHPHPSGIPQRSTRIPRIAIKAPAVVKFLLAYNAARKRWRPRARPHLTVPNGRQVVASTNDGSRASENDREREKERERDETRERARKRMNEREKKKETKRENERERERDGARERASKREKETKLENERERKKEK